MFSEKTLKYSIAYNEKIDGAPYQTGIGKIHQYTLPTNVKITYNYDKLERVSSKTYSNGMSVEYSYLTGSGESTTTPLVSSIMLWNSMGIDTTYSYTYDNVGNILTVKENGSLKQTFTYDKLGQLTREDNKYTNRTYVYTYDDAGNITAKNAYWYNDLTMPDGPVVNYQYNDSTWKDLLTNLNGTAITYDAIGNPLNWSNASSLTWSGRELCSAVLNSNNTLNFKYNSSGIRTNKNYLYYMPGGDTATQNTEYVLDGSKIIKEIRTLSIDSSVKYTYYYYDESGVK